LEVFQVLAVEVVAVPLGASLSPLEGAEAVEGICISKPELVCIFAKDPSIP